MLVRTVLAGMLVLALVAPGSVAHAQSAPADQYGGPPDAPGQNPPPGGGGNPGGGAGGGGGGSNPGGNGGGRGDQRGDRGEGRRGEQRVAGERGEQSPAGRRESGAAPPVREARGGSLPFTGLDLTALLFVGAVLVMVGALAKVVERRLAARRAR